MHQKNRQQKINDVTDEDDIEQHVIESAMKLLCCCKRSKSTVRLLFGSLVVITSTLQGIVHYVALRDDQRITPTNHNNFPDFLPVDVVPRNAQEHQQNDRSLKALSDSSIKSLSVEATPAADTGNGAFYPDSTTSTVAETSIATASTDVLWLNHYMPLSSSEVPISFTVPTNTTTRRICATWNISIDEWWIKNWQWKIVQETPNGYCLERWQAHSNRMKMYRKLYKNQWTLGNCSESFSKVMWSTGWGADFHNVMDGLGYGITHNIPFVINYRKEPWHYSKDVKADSCSRAGSLECYFLKYTKCPFKNTTTGYQAKIADKLSNMLKPDGQFMKDNQYFLYDLSKANNRYIYEWVTRPKTWLRNKVMESIQPYLTKLQSPNGNCSVIHVRRGDVVLHHNISRRYYSISEYIAAVAATEKHNNLTTNKTILLLTDDANAMIEAKTLYPNYNWVTIDRKRYQGPEGGWEGHFPSSDPLTETIVLLGTFKLVQQCTTLVHTHSNLALLFWGYMLSSRPKKDLTRIQIDREIDSSEKFDAKNSATVNISRSDW